MGHDHSHSHGHHHHDHSVTITNLNKAFYIGIGLNFLFVLIEVIAGLRIHSLSLLSDAGHNLADVASLALSLLAFRLAKVPPNSKYTYGYRKTTILVALFNAVVLLVSIGAIGYEAVHRFFSPEPLPGFTIAAVAGVGILINTVTALLFLRDKDKDMNIKSAYMHLMSDAIVSLALVVGGIIIYYTGWYWIDPVLGVVVAIVILLSTWSLLRGSLRLSLDGVPEGINIDDVKNAISKIIGVKDVHHIHIWALSTTANALTAHIVVQENTGIGELELLKKKVKHELEHLNIQHATLEFELEKDKPCPEGDC
ncbi:cation diffusion facilitator family transporter [Chitinophagaceae bacterium MMS25-I14]